MLLIKNLTKKKIKKRFLQAVERKALNRLRLGSRTEISIVIAGEKRMRKLNRIWRGKDRTTDVLSFGNQKPEFISQPDNVLRLGEIFICHSVAEKQARKYGLSLKEELARLLVHGILHLAGYDHEKGKAEEKKMLVLQEKIIKKIFSK